MRPRIVAELSANHNGSLGRAYDLIYQARKAGADAVKLQTFIPEQMANPGSIIQSGPWAGHDALDLYRQAHTPREWHRQLFDYAAEGGIEIFSSVFHPDDVDFLETLGCPRYKIASFELTDLELIKRAAATGKPLILSTGMADVQEIRNALNTARRGHRTYVTLLKCTSAYPAMASDANLATMRDMGNLFASHVGLSDHTMGHGVAVAAVALGATMIEKHLTLSRSDGGLDSSFSMEPDEFKAMVEACHQAADAIGEVRYGPLESEQASLQLRRKPGGKRL